MGLAPVCVDCQIGTGYQVPDTSGAGHGTQAVVAYAKVAAQTYLLGHAGFKGHGQVCDKQGNDFGGNGIGGNVVVDGHGS